jgi:hypothetical protein
LRTTLDANISTTGPFVMMLRHKGGVPALWFLARHSDTAVRFFWKSFLSSRRPDPKRMAEFDRVYDQRLRDFDENRSPLMLSLPTLTQCSERAQVTPRPPDRRWLATLRGKYQRGGTTVFITASPVPECDLHITDVQRELAPYLDANMEPLPMHDFVVGERHMTPQGAQDESHHLAQLIASRDQALKTETPR